MSSAIPERPTVLNTTILSNFAYLDRVELLYVLTRPVTPPTVRDELLAGAETYPYFGHATTNYPKRSQSYFSIPNQRTSVTNLLIS